MVVNRKPAPTAIRPKGMEAAPKSAITLSITGGSGVFVSPRRMPTPDAKMRGLDMISTNSLYQLVFRLDFGANLASTKMDKIFTCGTNTAIATEAMIKPVFPYREPAVAIPM